MCIYLCVCMCAMGKTLVKTFQKSGGAESTTTIQYWQRKFPSLCEKALATLLLTKPAWCHPTQCAACPGDKTRSGAKTTKPMAAKTKHRKSMAGSSVVQTLQ